MIRLETLRKTYSNGRGVRDIALELGPGIHGIIGPNGAGKTTVMKLVMGLLRPDEGRILVGGVDVWKESDGHSWRRGMGYLPAEDYFYGFLSGRRNLEYIALLKTGNRQAVDAIGDALEHLGVRDFWEDGFSSYSTGMKKKIQIAASLIGDPETLVWDEPNNGVDLIGNIFLRDLLEGFRAAGKTVMLSSHVIEFLEGLLDSLTVLAEGRIVLHAEPAPSDLRSAFLGALERGGER